MIHGTSKQTNKPTRQYQLMQIGLFGDGLLVRGFVAFLVYRFVGFGGCGFGGFLVCGVSGLFVCGYFGTTQLFCFIE